MDSQIMMPSCVEGKECHTYIKRKIRQYTIADFQLKLSHETWVQVFEENDVIRFLTLFKIFF